MAIPIEARGNRTLSPARTGQSLAHSDGRAARPEDFRDAVATAQHGRDRSASANDHSPTTTSGASEGQSGGGTPTPASGSATQRNASHNPFEASLLIPWLEESRADAPAQHTRPDQETDPDGTVGYDADVRQRGEDNQSRIASLWPGFVAQNASAEQERTPHSDEPAFSDLTDPRSLALSAILETVTADPTVDPETIRANEVAQAAAEANLWEGEAARLAPIADAEVPPMEQALATHGEGSMEFARAMADQRAAEAAYAEALAQSNQAWAQLEVYAADQAYAGAVETARLQFSDVPDESGLGFMPETGAVPLDVAQQRLEQRTAAADLATAARESYDAAVDDFSELQPNYRPAAEASEGDAFVESNGLDDTSSGQNLTAAQEFQSYWDGMLHLAEGDLSFASYNVQSLEADLALFEPGTLEFQEIETALAAARLQSPVAEANLAATMPEQEFAEANLRVAELERERDEFLERAFEDVFDGRPPEEMDLLGRVTGWEAHIEGGQLGLRIHFEDGPIDFQASHPPGERSDATEEEAEFDQDWFEFITDSEPGVVNVLEEAQLQRVQAEQNRNNSRADRVDIEIDLLETSLIELGVLPPDTRNADASTVAGQHSGTLHTLEDISPAAPYSAEVHAARDSLLSALEYRSQLEAESDWLNWLQTQPVANLGSDREEQRLRDRFFDESNQERQRWADSYDEIYGRPLQWSGGAEVASGVTNALNLPNLPGETQDQVEPVVDKIGEIGGEDAEVQVVPIRLSMDNGQHHQTALFVVTASDGGMRIVDDTGRDYDDLEDYRNNHRLPASGTLHLPENLQFTRNADGNISVQSVEVEGQSRNVAMDVGVGIVTTVATVASFTPAAPVAVPIATAGGGYFAHRSWQNLSDMRDHGQSWWSPEGAMEMATIATSALPVAAGGFRTVGLVRSGLPLAQGMRTGFGAVNYGRYLRTPFAGQAQQALTGGHPLVRAAHGMDMTGMAIGAPVMAVSGHNTVTNWDQMSGLDQATSAVDLAAGFHGTASGVRSVIRPPRSSAHPTAMPERLPTGIGGSDPMTYNGLEHSGGPEARIAEAAATHHAAVQAAAETAATQNASAQATETTAVAPPALSEAPLAQTTSSRHRRAQPMRDLIRMNVRLAQTLFAMNGMQMRMVAPQQPSRRRSVFKDAVFWVANALPGVDLVAHPWMSALARENVGAGNFAGRGPILFLIATAKSRFAPYTPSGILLRTIGGSSFGMNAVNNFVKVSTEFDPSMSTASQSFFAVGQTALGTRALISAHKQRKHARFTGTWYRADPNNLRLNLNVANQENWRSVSRQTGVDPWALRIANLPRMGDRPALIVHNAQSEVIPRREIRLRDRSASWADLATRFKIPEWALREVNGSAAGTHPMTQSIQVPMRKQLPRNPGVRTLKDVARQIGEPYGLSAREVLDLNGLWQTIRVNEVQIPGDYAWERSSEVSRWLQVAGAGSMSAAATSLGIVDYPVWGPLDAGFVPADAAIAVGTGGTAVMTAIPATKQDGSRVTLGTRSTRNGRILMAFQVLSSLGLSGKGAAHLAARQGLLGDEILDRNLDATGLSAEDWSAVQDMARNRAAD